MSDILDDIKTNKEGTKIIVLSPVTNDKNRSVEQVLNLFEQQGYARILIGGEVVRINEVKNNPPSSCHLVIDRLILKKDEDALSRLADSLRLLF